MYFTPPPYLPSFWNFLPQWKAPLFSPIHATPHHEVLSMPIGYSFLGLFSKNSMVPGPFLLFPLLTPWSRFLSCHRLLTFFPPFQNPRVSVNSSIKFSGLCQPSLIPATLEFSQHLLYLTAFVLVYDLLAWPPSTSSHSTPLPIITMPDPAWVQLRCSKNTWEWLTFGHCWVLKSPSPIHM